jgi:hypothetical protein
MGQMKEDDEGIRFHTLLTAGMYCGGRILPEKLRRWSVLGGGTYVHSGGGLQGGSGQGARAAHRGKARRNAGQGQGMHEGGDGILVA